MPGANGNTPKAYLNGSWRDWNAVQGNLGGTWRLASDVYMKHNDTWKKVWVRLTAPTGGSTSLSHVTATISWTAGVGQEGFKLYRNGTFVKNVAANATSTTDVVPAMQTNYTYTVSAYAGPTETAQISCGAAVSAQVGTPTISSSLVAGWGYINDSWNGFDVTFNSSTSAVANVSSYEIEYKYLNFGGTITNGYPGTGTSANISFGQDYHVEVRWRARIVHNGTEYNGAWSNVRTLLSGRPQIRTSRTDDYSVESWADRERYNGPGVSNSTTLPTSYTANNILVDSYQFRNLSASSLPASQITSSTRSVVLIKPGTNVTLSGTPYVSNGYDSAQYTNYTDGSNSYRIDATGTGWFNFADSRKLVGTIRFLVRYVSQSAVNPSTY
jgi:hypothetical protein